MRYTDIYFFVSIILAIVFIIFLLITGIEMTYIAQMWWIILLPGFILKVFFKNNKVTKWLERDRLEPLSDYEIKIKKRKKALDKLL